MTVLKVRLTFDEEVLGLSPNDDEIYTNFIGTKAPDAATLEEEVAALGVEEVVEKTMTIFPRNKDGVPFLWNYQIKGFFKDACGALQRVKGAKKGDLGYQCGKIKAYRKIIDGCVFVSPRQIPFKFEGEVGTCERPLRIGSREGERTALACSETIPADSVIELEIKCLSDDHVDFIKECLDYGELRGISQWRNSGKGVFRWEQIS